MLDANNHLTRYDYDSRGRLTTTTYPDNKTVVNTYDGLGLVATTTDQENRTTTYLYDKASQLTFLAKEAEALIVTLREERDITSRVREGLKELRDEERESKAG